MPLKVLLPLLLALVAGRSLGTETVQLATYHAYAPWTVPANPADGLNVKLAKALNAMSGGRYRFEASYIPRQRLDVLLQSGKINMVVLLHVASRPRTVPFERSILVPKDKPQSHEFLNQAIKALRADSGRIAGARTVRITNGEWPPYLGARLPHGGVGLRIVSEAFKAQGIGLEHAFFPWMRSYVLANTPAFDGGALWARSPARERDFYFSDPVLQSNTAFFHLKRNAFEWHAIDDLKGYRIGVTRGYYYGPGFMGAIESAKLRTQAVSTDLLNFHKLLAGRIDAFPMDTVVGQSLLRQHFSPAEIESVAIAPKSLYSQPLHLMLRKTQPESRMLIAQFNAGLRKLKANGQYDAYLHEAFERDAHAAPAQ